MNGFPNWRDREAYPSEDAFTDPELLKDDPLFTSKAWAWQFLRRNQQYQEDYDQLRKEGNRGAGKSIAQKYGMIYLLDYRSSNQETIPFERSAALRQFTQGRNDRLQLSQHEIALIFDLHLPIDFQLEFARKQFLEAQRELNVSALPESRKRTQHFIRYLRIIDAKRTRERNSAIAHQFLEEGIYSASTADKLYVGQARFEKDWARARELRDRGYLPIAYT